MRATSSLIDRRLLMQMTRADYAAAVTNRPHVALDELRAQWLRRDHPGGSGVSKCRRLACRSTSPRERSPTEETSALRRRPLTILVSVGAQAGNPAIAQ
jgi:hypothetical protein